MSSRRLLPFLAALSPFFPMILRWLSGPTGHDIGEEIARIAQRIAGTDNHENILSLFRDNPKARQEFQLEMYRLAEKRQLAPYKDRRNARARDLSLRNLGRRNRRADFMVAGSGLGLLLCLFLLGFYRASLSGEVVGILSTIAGIFGSCLKDAYAFEFGTSRMAEMKNVQKHVRSGKSVQEKETILISNTSLKSRIIYFIRSLTPSFRRKA